MSTSPHNTFSGTTKECGCASPVLPHVMAEIKEDSFRIQRVTGWIQRVTGRIQRVAGWIQELLGGFKESLGGFKESLGHLREHCGEELHGNVERYLRTTRTWSENLHWCGHPAGHGGARPSLRAPPLRRSAAAGRRGARKDVTESEGSNEGLAHRRRGSTDQQRPGFKIHAPLHRLVIMPILKTPG